VEGAAHKIHAGTFGLLMAEINQNFLGSGESKGLGATIDF
jgi:hypothetical protein